MIIDDHSLFVDGLALILRNLGQDVDVSTSNSAAACLINPMSLENIDLVLIDLEMPSMNGFNFLSAVRMQNLPLRVAVISGTEKKSEIERALSEGAFGFIPKDTPSHEMLSAVTHLLAGNRYLPPKWLGYIDWKPNVDIRGRHSATLTKRQRDVLELVADGLHNKQIASVLGISISAVKRHVENVFKKLGVNNRTSCVKVAREKNLL